MINKVAVYGTLKRDYRANHMLSSATFIGEGHTVDSYLMTDVGFPKISPDSDGYPVRVEVYDGPDFNVLDRYEGVPNLYSRRVVPIKLDNGDIVDAYIYETCHLTGESVSPADGKLEWRRGYA